MSYKIIKIYLVCVTLCVINSGGSNMHYAASAGPFGKNRNWNDLTDIRFAKLAENIL